MQIKITEDGSHTLYSPLVDECYHSQNGAIRESEHIFIKAGWEQCEKDEVKIFEVGFGTGLNVLLTLLEAEKENKRVFYTTLEYYPVGSEVVDKLNYFELLDKDRKHYFRKLHDVSWNKPEKITPFFTLEKLRVDFTQYELTDSYDLFYFDAFSPEKQPEMWTQERFETLYAHAGQDAVLVTYCAKGVVRRSMQAAGFKVERLSGPPGKREILRARKI